MRPLWFAFRHCLSWAAPATVLAIAVLWIGFAATGLATPWLHLAAFLPTTVAGLAAIARAGIPGAGCRGGVRAHGRSLACPDSYRVVRRFWIRNRAEFA